MKVNILTQGLFQILVLLFIIFKGDKLFGVNSDRELEHYEWNDQHGYHFTIFFDIFVFMQVFNSINARKLNPKEFNVFEGIKNNIYYIIVQGFIVFGQILLVTFGGRAVRTQPLSLFQHFCCGLIASLSLVVGYLVKLIPYDLSEKIVKTKEEIEEGNEEERIMNERKEKMLKKKKSKGPNLTLRRMVIPPRNRKITYNEININTEKYKKINNINNIKENNNNKNSSPIVLNRKNMTPIYSTRRQEETEIKKNSNNTNQKDIKGLNLTNKTNNIKTIYSYNTNDKNSFNTSSNNISINDNKNLFEDLLSEDTKRTENSTKKKILSEKKDEKDENFEQNSITPRFNNNKDKKTENTKEDNNDYNIKRNNLFDNFSEESTENKSLKNTNTNINNYK
jgi:hypothetical protein